MANLGLVWLEFIVCAALIGFAGPELSRSGDIIAEKTGLSHNWIGLILLATVTSLPELITGLSSVTIADVPNIAVGDVLGSCVFNLTILVVLDFLHRDEPIYRRAHQGHILSAGFGDRDGRLCRHQRAPRWAEHYLQHRPRRPLFADHDRPLLLAIRSVFIYERHQREEFVEEVAAQYAEMTLRSAVRRYCGGGRLVAAGVWLPFVGSDLADAMGWNRRSSAPCSSPAPPRCPSSS